MALWAPVRHCCFCFQLSGATSCALWEGQTHFTRCGVTSLLVGWMHTHVLNRAWKNEDTLVSFLIFLPTVFVPQHVSGSSIIKRGALANSATVYYCNCMCKVFYLMLACYVNRIKYVFLRCNRELLRRCETMLWCVDQCSTTLWLQRILTPSANLISLLSVPINSCVWNEWPVWRTRFLQDKHLLWAFVFIYNHSYH